ncbi:hypothetical protein Tco_1357293 [Tanacetum coccineum]
MSKRTRHGKSIMGQSSSSREPTMEDKRVGLYSQDLAKGISTRSGLRRTVTVKAEKLLMEFWPTIGDGEFVVGGRSVKKC